jgi:lysophospholipid acyltransferase (LPLAT)-like uncharacterized protein
VSWRRTLRLQGLLFVAAPLLRLLASTWRIEWRGQPLMRSAASPARLFAFWHGGLLPIAWAIRGRGIVAMVSEHRDGELIARVLEGWGFGLVRGSSTRGGGKVLLGMIRALAEGRDGAITPDGPRGPAEVPHIGTVRAAQRAGVAITPLRVEASRAWRARSWDRFLVPKPFARVVITADAPWPPGEGDDASLVDELRRRIGGAGLA